jgi:hypothetical protein
MVPAGASLEKLRHAISDGLGYLVRGLRNDLTGRTVACGWFISLMMNTLGNDANRQLEVLTRTLHVE